VSIRETLQHWVNAGVMTVFFFVVGLEIKRELVAGELRDRRAAALPAIAAVSGMAAPAVLYVAVNAGGSGGHGWGIPVAAGVVLGLLTPMTTRRGARVLERLEHQLHPWSSFLVVPLFALANVGIVLRGAALRDAWSSRITIGVVVGLVVGKLAGVLGGTLL